MNGTVFNFLKNGTKSRFEKTCSGTACLCRRRCVMTTAKDFLRLVRLAEERAEPEMERLRTLVDRAGYGTGQKEAQRVSGTSQRSRVECNVCAMIDLESEINKA